ncbi:MAG: elongation factor P [Alphaproteobacteria bacterium]|nr:elongation factor P [Alphaproteobacteria bacterium]MBN2780037.1 elongation factor P [Alphaproteobacteria bacterium]
MKIDVNKIRVGNILECKGKRCIVLKKEATQPGKGGAIMQLELRDLDSGNKFMDSLATNKTVEKLETSQKEVQYLYTEGPNLVFMTMDDYEQFNLPATLLGERLPFLQESMMVSVHYIENDPISIHLPKTINAIIAETEGVVKGQTAASSNKPAILDNGARVMVPPFIKTGDEVVVNTEEMTYLERAKK